MVVVKIGDLADTLHSRTRRWKALALLEAYFDESGTHAQSRITAIGGLVAKKEAWVAFEADLAEILLPYRDKGVKVFHMTEALAQKGQFAFIEKPFINNILWSIAKALRKAEVTAIYAGVVQDDWDRLWNADPKDDANAMTDAFKAAFPKPFDLCFRESLHQLAMWSKNHGDGEPVAPIYAVTGEYQGRMSIVGANLDRSQKYAGLLSGVTFCRPETLTPLQAADFAAHLMRDEIERREYWEGLDRAGPTQVFHLAAGGAYRHGCWYDAASLGIAVRRFTETGDI